MSPCTELPEGVAGVVRRAEFDGGSNSTASAAVADAGGDKWRVLIRPVNAPRITRVVDAEQDAIDLVHHLNRLGVAGEDLAAARAKVKASIEETIGTDGHLEAERHAQRVDLGQYLTPAPARERKKA